MSTDKTKGSESDVTRAGEVSSLEEEKGKMNINEIDNPLFGTKTEKKIIRNLDFRLVLMLGLLFGTSLMDRGNLPNARIAGMGDDLALNVGQRYSIISLVFFPAYIIAEIPANLLLKRLPPSIWLPSITLAFGVIMIGFGFVNDWKPMIALRFILGLAEGGLLPGALYLISSWYTRHEVGVRITTMYLIGQVCSAVSNPLAYAFSLADGQSGLEGWRYIFIFFGLVTAIFAIISVFVIPAFPERSTIFSPEEKQLILDRLNKDRGDAQADKATVKTVLHAMKDWKVWVIGTLYGLTTVSSYAHSYFLTIILRDNLGFSVKDSQVLTMCPYLLAVIVGITTSYYADKLKIRGPFIASGYVITMVGLSLLSFAPVNGVRFFGAFLSLPGTQISVTLCLVWKANNVVGATKRSVSSAIVVLLGGIGGIVASVAYNQNDAPQYVPGIATTIACQGTGLVITLFMMYYFNLRNTQMRTGKRTEPLEGQEGFYYTL